MFACKPRYIPVDLHQASGSSPAIAESVIPGCGCPGVTPVVLVLPPWSWCYPSGPGVTPVVLVLPQPAPTILPLLLALQCNVAASLQVATGNGVCLGKSERMFGKSNYGFMDLFLGAWCHYLHPSTTVEADKNNIL